MKKLLCFFILVLLMAATVDAANIIVTGIVSTRVWRLGSDGVTWYAIRIPTVELYIDGTYDFDVDGQLPLWGAYDGNDWVSRGGTTAGTGAPRILTNTFLYVYGTASSFNDVWGTRWLERPAEFNNVCTAEATWLNDIVDVSEYDANNGGNDGLRIGTEQIWQQDSNEVYRHSWMYRKNGTGPDGFTFDANDWIFGGNDVLRVDEPNDHNFMRAEELRYAVPFGTYQPCPDDPDLVTNGRVDFVDFAFLAARWGNNCPPENRCCDGANLYSAFGDAVVDFKDLARLLEHWLEEL